MNRAGLAASALLRSLPVIAFFSLPSACEATLVGPGDIAFLRFNADGTDDLAIVLLADADAGQQVHFNDNAYSSQFNVFANSEDKFTWNITEDLPAGTVVTFTNLDSSVSPGIASHGTITGDSTRTMQLGATGETVYAFLGPNNQTPTSFLAAVTTESSSVLDGTGLVAGDTAVVLPAGIDEAQFVGDRDTEMMFSDYRPLIGNVAANWQVRTTDTGSLPTFDTTNFSLEGAVATPESPRAVLFGALLMLTVCQLCTSRRAGHSCLSRPDIRH